MARDREILCKEVLSALLMFSFMLLLFNTPKKSCSFVFNQSINFLKVTKKRAKILELIIIFLGNLYNYFYIY